MFLEKQLTVLKQIDACFLELSGKNLPFPSGISDPYRWLDENAPYSILAHNCNDDPVFVYANKFALSCFKYSQDEMLLLPSRLSVAIGKREEREILLNSVKQDGIAYNCTGERIDKYDNNFSIYDGIIWQLKEKKGKVWGQGALFWSTEKDRPEWYNNCK